MFARYALHATFVVMLLCTGNRAVAFKDDPTNPGADARLGKILDEWQRRSSQWKSLEVRYVGLQNNLNWRDQELFLGRIVLLPKGQALVEVKRSDHAEERKIESTQWVWTVDALHEIRRESKKHTVWPISGKDRGRLPAPLVLPFCWNLSTEGLNSRYRVELVKEDAETWLLRVAPRSKTGAQGFTAAFILLDRATYLPRRYHVTSPDGRTTTEYRIKEVRIDQAVPDEVLRLPSGKDWEVTKESILPSFLLSRFSSPDLLP
jgi:hypothetical protein